MDKDRIAGSTKQVKGSIKEAVGKAVGDVKLQSEGESDRVLGARLPTGLRWRSPSLWWLSRTREANLFMHHGASIAATNI